MAHSEGFEPGSPTDRVEIAVNVWGLRALRDAWEEIAPGTEGPFTDCVTGNLLGTMARWVDSYGPAEALEFLARVTRLAADACKPIPAAPGSPLAGSPAGLDEISPP